MRARKCTHAIQLEKEKANAANFKKSRLCQSNSELIGWLKSLLARWIQPLADTIQEVQRDVKMLHQQMQDGELPDQSSKRYKHVNTTVDARASERTTTKRNARHEIAFRERAQEVGIEG